MTTRNIYYTLSCSIMHFCGNNINTQMNLQWSGGKAVTWYR